MIYRAIKDLLRGVELRNVWAHQAYHEITSKYKRTFLGSIWVAASVVATSLSLAIVIGGIQGQSISDVLPYIMTGIMAFSLCGYILNEAVEVFMSSANTIKNHAHPFSYYIFESTSRNFFVFIHNLIPLYVILIMLKAVNIPHWSIIFGIPIVYFTSFFWGTLTAMLGARYRDLRFMFPFLGQILFFLTPVFWIPTNFDNWRKAILDFNPFYGLVEVIRSPLLGKAPPELAWTQSFTALSTLR
jgi:ABC-type polysaccharide/polyol phosphate export permease